MACFLTLLSRFHISAALALATIAFLAVPENAFADDMSVCVANCGTDGKCIADCCNKDDAGDTGCCDTFCNGDTACLTACNAGLQARCVTLNCYTSDCQNPPAGTCAAGACPTGADCTACKCKGNASCICAP